MFLLVFVVARAVCGSHPSWKLHENYRLAVPRHRESVPGSLVDPESPSTVLGIELLVQSPRGIFFGQGQTLVWAGPGRGC